jgi:nucleotide-binding universal stress UspA family protein
MGLPADRLTEMSERSAQHLVHEFRERIGPRSKATEFVEPGKPSARIIEVANNWHAHLIVMGSHGRGKIGGLLLGSVSQEVFLSRILSRLDFRAHT